MKPSSRAGRFKKKLVSEDQLLRESSQLEKLITPFYELFTQQKITDAEFTGLFIILSLSLRYPGMWLGAKRPSFNINHRLNFPLKDLPFEPNIKKRLPETLGELFNQFALKSTPETVNRAILSWSNGPYPLELMFRIPNPREVLDQQKHGRRCVTVLFKENQIGRFILGERDYLSFTMHDLIHADHFYYHNDCYYGQLGLYGLLHQTLCQGVFKELMSDPKFQYEFEYLIADMNAYAIHSLKCLKAAIEFYGNKEIYQNWISQFSVAKELGLLNTPDYDPHKYDQVILDWISSFITPGVIQK